MTTLNSSYYFSTIITDCSRKHTSCLIYSLTHTHTQQHHHQQQPHVHDPPKRIVRVSPPECVEMPQLLFVPILNCGALQPFSHKQWFLPARLNTTTNNIYVRLSDWLEHQHAPSRENNKQHPKDGITDFNKKAVAGRSSPTENTLNVENHHQKASRLWSEETQIRNQNQCAGVGDIFFFSFAIIISDYNRIWRKIWDRKATVYSAL